MRDIWRRSYGFGAIAACLGAATLAACGGPSDATGVSHSGVVYGSDSRQDVYAHPTAALRERAQQSTVALMHPSVIDTSNPNGVVFRSSTLQASQGLCSTERFLDDPTAAFCSGTLIDDDLVLTAGHCVTSPAGCADTRFVFNYYRPSAGALQSITTADIFSCASIVTRQQAVVGNRELDFAIVRLDRPATPRFTPAPVRGGNTALPVGQGVAVIGCGSGIPFKIDSGGTVRDARASTLDYFVATTDTFGGNSGSGVYETNGYTVAGILVRGDTDYVSNGACQVVNTCAETGCSGESITYVAPAINALCATSTSARLCGSTPPIPPTPTPSNSFTFTASNTRSAQRNTVNQSVTLTAGQTIQLGTCTISGASGTGDTYLRLYDPSGVQVAANDDSCGTLSYLTYTVPADRAGAYQIRAGCYSNGSCGGTVAYTIQ